MVRESLLVLVVYSLSISGFYLLSTHGILESDLHVFWMLSGLPLESIIPGRRGHTRSGDPSDDRAGK